MVLNPLFLNYCFDKSRLKSLITWSLLATGEMRTIKIVEKLKELGFRFATKAGISLSLDDLKIPPEKVSLVSQATQQAEGTQQEYQRGNLTTIECSQHLIDTWHRTSETLKQTVVNNFQLTDKLSPVYMMAFSGARGNISQVRQLAGMRGLMADPQGQIIGFPIRSNFREGLTLTEYMISCYGARKGLVDTALRTADAGYLTRRLVDVSQHMIVKTATCATSNGAMLKDIKASGKVILPLRDRLIGRVLAQDVYKEDLPTSQTKGIAGPSTASLPCAGNGEIPLLASRNQEISVELASQIASYKSWVSVRSPLTCSVRHGVCQLCYGWSLSEGRLVTLGEAVGIIAAQSIGEPGTQLTMRTFHTGGVFSGDVMAEIRSPFDGIVSFPRPLQGLLIRTSHGRIAFLTKAEGTLALSRASVYNLSKKEAGTIDAGTIDEAKRAFPEQQLRESSERMAQEANATPPDPVLRGPVRRDLVSTGQLAKEVLIGTEDWDAHFCLEPATVLFVRQGEKVRQGQLVAEFSSIGPEANETVEAKRTLFSDIAGQVSFSNMAIGTRLKENGEIVQVSKDLGFIWVLSGNRAPITPLLDVYNRGSHLVSKESLVTRISAQVSNQNLQARAARSEIAGYARNIALEGSVEDVVAKRSLGISMQSVEKDQPFLLCNTPAPHFLSVLKTETTMFAGSQLAAQAGATPFISFISDIGYSLLLLPTASKMAAYFSGNLNDKAKGLTATCVAAQVIPDTPVWQDQVPGVAKLAGQEVLTFPWLDLPLPRRLHETALGHQSLGLGRGRMSLPAMAANNPNSLFDFLFHLANRNESTHLYQKRGAFRSIPSNLSPKRSREASLPGIDFVWFPKKYRSDRGGLAWIDSRYVSQQHTFGELFWIPEDTIVCYSWWGENAQSLQFKMPCEVDGHFVFSSAPLIAKHTGNNTQVDRRKADYVLVSSGGNPVWRDPVKKGKISSHSNTASSRPLSFGHRLQSNERREATDPPLVQRWTNKDAVVIGKKNLQGRESRQITCLGGWVTREPLQLLTLPAASIGSDHELVQPAILSHSKRDICADPQDRVSFQTRHGREQNGGFFATPSPARAQKRTLTDLQHCCFQKVALPDGSFPLYKKPVSSNFTSNLSESGIREAIADPYLILTREDSGYTAIPQLSTKQNHSNPLARGVKEQDRRIAKDRTFVQSWLAPFKERTEPHPFDKIPVAGSSASPSKTSDKLVSDADNSLKTGLQSSLTLLQSRKLKIFRKGRGRRVLHPQQAAPSRARRGFARQADGTGKPSPSTLRLKTGWMYYPRDHASLTVCHEGTKHTDGRSLDSLFFDAAFVYFDALKTPSFSYSLATIGLNFSIKLKALQRGSEPIIVPSTDGNVFAFQEIISMFEHILVQGISSRCLNGKPLKLQSLSKLDLYKNRRLPFLNAWKPTFLLCDTCFTPETSSNISCRKPSDPAAPRSLGNEVARDLLLFLRKLLWLGERPVVQSESILLPAAQRPPLRGAGVAVDSPASERVSFLISTEKHLEQARIRPFQLLYWKDLANRSRFLWLRAFQLQFQVITNQKARHRLPLPPRALPEEALSMTNENDVLKTAHLPTLPSKKQAWNSKTRHIPSPDGNDSALVGDMAMQRINRSIKPDIYRLLTLIPLSNTPPLLQTPSGSTELLSGEKGWCQSCYKGKEDPFDAVVMPTFLFTLIRKGQRYSLETISKGKSSLLRATQSKKTSSKREEETKTFTIGKDFDRRMVWPSVRRNAIDSRWVSLDRLTTSNINLSARIGGLIAITSTSVDDLGAYRPDRSSSRKISFESSNKQLPTKLVSKAPAIGFSIKPVFSFGKFQTTSILKPLQMIRFAAHSMPSGCDQEVVRKNIVSPRPLMSPQGGELFAQYSQPRHIEDHTDVEAWPCVAPDQTLPSSGETRFLGNRRWPSASPAAPFFPRNASAPVTLLTESDYVSLSTIPQSLGFVRKLGPIIQRSVGQFLNLGEEITDRYGSAVAGQVVSIEKGKITLRRTQPLLFYAQGAMHVNHGEWVNKNAPILTLTYQKLVTGDIVAGIPKIEQFFEAPATKEGGPMPNSLQAKLRKTFKRWKAVLPLSEAAKKSLDEIQQILVEGVLKVYLSQGVRIADKHLEIVIRQMTSKGHILDVGKTGLFQGEHVNLHRIERINLATYGEKAEYEPAVLGITQASLDSESFISAASFQETTRVLSRDTIAGKTDFLRGLKERVVLGDLIQAGTGLDDNINYGLLLGVSMPLLPSDRVAPDRVSSNRVLLDQNQGRTAKVL